MKTTIRKWSRSQAGHSILLVMIISTATFLVLGGLLKWSVGNTTANVRNNQYFKTVAAAEAATEKVISHLTTDYFEDESIASNLDRYRELVPTAEESARWGKYVFSDGEGNNNRTYVEHLPPDEFRVLDSQYRGLHGYASAFRVISNARELGTVFPMTAALRQDVEVAMIPLFQFAIFYNLDLEINPGPPMVVTGPVHCNRTIYLRPGDELRFKSDVTAVGALATTRHPDDPSYPGVTTGRVIFEAEHDAGVPSLNLPIGTNNTPVGVRQIVEVPPPSESPDSPMGRQRYYNKADLILLVQDTGIKAFSGATRTNIHTNEIKSFLTNVTFFDQREGRTVKASQIDVGRLRLWNETNKSLKLLLNSNDVRIVYIADQRSQSSSTMPGVRLVNGHTILPKGLTVATPNPLYVRGNYNISTNGSTVPLPTTNTVMTRPASLVGDAITVLSQSWNDSAASSGISSRSAAATTVNAAFLAGIVQTTNTGGGSYSGGVENFPRFLENWSGKVFTYNGSMVVMYGSKQATRKWPGTGEVYNPPNRAWSFDQNFRDINRLPPGTPVARTLIRGKWYTMKPGTTEVVSGTVN
jgi:hypothetical protein